MHLESQSFEPGGRIPAACAFAEPDPRTRFRFAGTETEARRIVE